MRLCLVVAAMLAVLMIPASSFAVGLEVAVGVWQQEPSGQMGFEAGGTSDFIDLESDAGFDDETEIMGRAKIDLPVLPNIYLMATPMEYEGEGRKDVTFRFGDISYRAGADFDARLTMDQYDIALYYGLPFLKTATNDVLNVEVGLDAKIVDLEVEVRGTDDVTGTTVTENESVTVPLPLIYVGAQLAPVDWLGLEAELRGLEVSGNHFYDFIGRVKLRPSGPFFAAVGWRFQDLEIDEDEVLVDIEFAGPFAEVGLEF